MPLLFKRPALLPACLTVGALLCALPTLADPAPAPAAGAVKTQTLPLQHVVPGDILKTLHWDQAVGLPEGVTRISALPATNSLSVVATPAGLARVQQIVKLLDIAQRQVQIKAALAQATAADLKASGINFDVIPDPAPGHPPGSGMGYASGITAVAELLRTLQAQGAVLQSPTVITTNNVDAALNVSDQPMPTLPKVESFTFAVTPRVNSDDTLTLALHPKMSWRVTGKTNPPGLRGRSQSWNFQTLRTIRSGDTLVFTNVFAGAAGAGDRQLLLFVTPTILPTGGGTAAVTVK